MIMQFKMRWFFSWDEWKQQQRVNRDKDGGSLDDIINYNDEALKRFWWGTLKSTRQKKTSKYS